AAVGSLIDAYFLFPLLTPSQKIDSPKIADIGVQSASEGSPVMKMYGPGNRVSGTLIWLSDIQRVSSSTTTGGNALGKGGTTTTSSHQHFVDVAVGIGEGTIGGIHKVWADGRLIYDNVD